MNLNTASLTSDTSLNSNDEHLYVQPLCGSDEGSYGFEEGTDERCVAEKLTNDSFGKISESMNPELKHASLEEFVDHANNMHLPPASAWQRFLAAHWRRDVKLLLQLRALRAYMVETELYSVVKLAWPTVLSYVINFLVPLVNLLFVVCSSTPHNPLHTHTHTHKACSLSLSLTHIHTYQSFSQFLNCCYSSGSAFLFLFMSVFL